jgi:hypothetical protein
VTFVKILAIWLALALVVGALWALAGWLWGQRGTRGRKG